MNENELPPGPPLPALVQSLVLFRWSLPFLRWCQRRYGETFTVNSALMGKIIYLTDPVAIKELFALDGKDGHAGVVNSQLEIVTGSHSLLLLDRESHLAERRLLSPAFHGAAIESLEEVARQAAKRELENWEDGVILAARPAMQRITFEVIVRAVLGVDDPLLRKRLLHAFEPVFNIPPMVLFPALRVDLGPLSPWGRFRRAMDHLDRLLLDLIRERRAEDPREDILGVLLAATEENGEPLSDSHVRDELVTLLLAGHETTATALSWALERLARHPAVLNEVRSALGRRDDALIDAVAAETLRVRPLVPGIARQLSTPVELGGYRLPAGTTVVPSIELVHADDRHHANASTFDPQRFMNRKPSNETWLPFGGGRRRCIGARLAQMELRVILSTILSEYMPRPVSKQVERARVRGITLAPGQNARLKMIHSSVVAAAGE
jgi:cytochrome P450